MNTLTSGIVVTGEKIKEWKNQSSNSKDVLGQFDALMTLGACYREGIIVKQDLKESARLYSMAAELGYPTAQYCLGLLYHDGAGVKKCNELSASWFAKAASNNFDKAQPLVLGNKFLDEKDYSTAAFWFGKAAKQGCPEAQVNKTQCILCFLSTCTLGF